MPDKHDEMIWQRLQRRLRRAVDGWLVRVLADSSLIWAESTAMKWTPTCALTARDEGHRRMLVTELGEAVVQLRQYLDRADIDTPEVLSDASCLEVGARRTVVSRQDLLRMGEIHHEMLRPLQVAEQEAERAGDKEAQRLFIGLADLNHRMADWYADVAAGRQPEVTEPSAAFV